MDPGKSLGGRIRELREQRDLSLREFARNLGHLSPAHVSDIELGRRYPSESVLQRMADVLQVPYEELQRYDQRLPVGAVRRIIDRDPAFGFALRKLVDKEISAEEILKLAKGRPTRRKP